MEPKPFVYTFRQHINFFAFFLIRALKAQHISQQSIIRAIVFFCVWCARLAGAECYARHVNKAVDGKQIRESWNEFFCVVLFFLFGAPPRGVVFLLPHMSSVWPECHAPSRSHRQIFFCSVLMFFFSGSFVKATERRVKCKTDSALFVIEDRH